MEEQFSDYYEDLVLLSDYLGEGQEGLWSHELRKRLLLLIHKLKNLSRASANAEIEAELIAIEVTIGFGGSSKSEPDTSLVEDHQLRLLELSDFYWNNLDDDDSNAEEAIIENEISEEVAAEVTIDETEIRAVQLILCNCPGRDAARELAHSLVKARQAACVNIISNIGSIYWWNGEIQDTAECQLQIKTAVTPIDDVISFIKQNHPSDVPEILIIPIDEGNEDYFDWVREESKQP
jgi:periplasmic divalent cation tolerance protein